MIGCVSLPALFGQLLHTHFVYFQHRWCSDILFTIHFSTIFYIFEMRLAIAQRFPDRAIFYSQWKPSNFQKCGSSVWKIALISSKNSVPENSWTCRWQGCASYSRLGCWVVPGKANLVPAAGPSCCLNSRLLAFLAARPGPYELHVQYMSCEGQDEREIAGPAW
jgi:hypothetical protein